MLTYPFTGVLPTNLPVLPSMVSLPTIIALGFAMTQIVLAMISFSTAKMQHSAAALTFISGLTHDYLAGLFYQVIYRQHPIKPVHILQLATAGVSMFIINAVILSLSPISDLTEISRNISEVTTGAVSFVILSTYIIAAGFLSGVYLNRSPVNCHNGAESDRLLGEPDTGCTK